MICKSDHDALLQIATAIAMTLKSLQKWLQCFTSAYCEMQLQWTISKLRKQSRWSTSSRRATANSKTTFHICFLSIGKQNKSNTMISTGPWTCRNLTLFALKIRMQHSASPEAEVSWNKVLLVASTIVWESVPLSTIKCWPPTWQSFFWDVKNHSHL